MDLQKDLSQVKQLEPKRKFTLFALLLILFLSGFGLGVFLSKPKVLPAPAQIVSPATEPKKVIKAVIFNLQKESEQWTLQFDPVDNQVFGVELELSYQAESTTPKVNKGNLFNQYLLLEVSKGKIKILAINLGENLETLAASGPGTLVQIPAIAGLSQLDFLPEKILAVDKNGQSLPIKIL